MDVFFYGLFMDIDLLRDKGLNPANPRKGYLPDYALKIGNRASLVPSPKGKSYGIVITVDQHALDQLYAEEIVADYIPEAVQIIAFNGETIPATCYNLPATKLTGTNPVYAQSLYELATQLDFPEAYLEKIRPESA